MIDIGQFVSVFFLVRVAIQRDKRNILAGHPTKGHDS
jgi:hypothetical protein